MCGRYSLVLVGNQLIRRFGVKPYPLELRPRYNVAPAQEMPIITSDDPKHITIGKWGLRPIWMKDRSGDGLINAKAETINIKPSFKSALKNHRCLIPADSFYEWDHQSGPKKQPYRFSLKNGQPFAMAGIFQIREESGKKVPGYAIITTAANELVGRIHDRMPVILSPETEAVWLNGQSALTATMASLRPFPAKQMTMVAISPAINSARRDDADLIKPLPGKPVDG